MCHLLENYFQQTNKLAAELSGGYPIDVSFILYQICGCSELYFVYVIGGRLTSRCRVAKGYPNYFDTTYFTV